MLHVKLTPHELRMAAIQALVQEDGDRPKMIHEELGIWTNLIEQSCAEMAFSKGRSKFWSGAPAEPVVVHWSPVDSHAFWFDPELYTPDHYHIFVRGAVGDYYVIGYIKGEAIKIAKEEPQWLQESILTPFQ